MKICVGYHTYWIVIVGAEVTPHGSNFLCCTGMWFMHCHYDFHLSMGMAAVFIVEDGTTADTSLPPPPVFSSCSHDNSLMPQEFFLKAK